MIDKSVFKRLARKYKTPSQVQRFLRELPYNREPHGETVRSALGALRANSAHCLEAAFVAAAILEYHGYPPLVLSLESKDNLDHVIYVFREKGKWGAVARSREGGLHGRKPIFRSLRDLTYSYFDPFIDKSGRVTGYGLAHLDHTGCDWRYSRNNVWKAEQFLIAMPHRRLRASHRRYLKWFAYFKKTGRSGRRQHHWW